MNLKDLFVSHKQVDPVIFNPSFKEDYKPLYMNFARAQQAISDEFDSNEDSEESENASSTKSITWKVKDYIDPNTPLSVPTQTITVPSSSGQTAIWTSIYKQDPDNKRWIADMTAAYKRAGLKDDMIKSLIAKNALESGWGKYAQGSYNFGNLTVGSNWNGKFVTGKDSDGKGSQISQKFRAYDSIDEYVKDEIQFLSKLYDFNPNDDFETFIKKLDGKNKAGRKYAGVSDYAARVRRVYKGMK